MSDEKRFWSRIPSHLFGGKVRTATLGLCVLWLALWMLYLFLNQPDKPAEVPPSAVIISETPYVPYVPPASTAPTATTLPPTATTYPSGTGTPPSVTTTVPPRVPNGKPSSRSSWGRSSGMANVSTFGNSEGPPTAKRLILRAAAR